MPRNYEPEFKKKIVRLHIEQGRTYVSEGRIKAHFLICFLALLFYRLLEKKMDKNTLVKEF